MFGVHVKRVFSVLPRRSRWSLGIRSSSSSSSGSSRATDTLYKDQNDTWVDKHVAPGLVPYAKLMRLDRPIGTWLLLLPGWWSIGLAAGNGTMADLKLMSLFAVGAVVMRGAGCTINDFWDRDIDGKVARTKERPLASGRVSPMQALTFLGLQATVGLGVLVNLNQYSIILGACSVIPVVLYPLAKRVTNWPQAVLGLTINWGALLGWSAVHGSLDLSVVLPLYLGGATWTLFYDTIYAHQDKKDDQSLGLRSTALTIGDQYTKPVLGGFALTSLGLWTLAGYNAGLQDSTLFHMGVGASGAHMFWQLYTADLNDRMNLTNRFVSNRDVGLFMTAGIMLGKYFAF